jgi:hypothetical protein
VFARKKKRENRGDDFFTNVNLAVSLAQDLLAAAILAVFGQNLPFWQSALPAVLAGSNRPDWVLQPPVVGDRVVTP